MAGRRRPLTRTKKTMKQLGPLARQLQEVQNDLVRLARKLDRLQEAIQVAEGLKDVEAAERARLQPETEYMLHLLSLERAREVLSGERKSHG